MNRPSGDVLDKCRECGTTLREPSERVPFTHHGDTATFLIVLCRDCAQVYSEAI
jgi:uncharacterized protein with PIN domain